jgi:RNA polymerase sigma factor (sigma-70 family)
MTPLFRKTSTASFDRLYRRHAPSVYRYARAVVGNHADAEDVTQQTFLNAYRAIAQGTKPRKAENWLLTIAHNEVRRHFRTTKGKSLEVEFDEELVEPAPESGEQTVADVLRALQHLPPAQRSALVMREFEGRSYAEIAGIMNVTQSALEALIFRARRSLAEVLEGELTCAEAEAGLSLRLDGRLQRRDARRLKVHLRECPECARFAQVQKRQRSLLKGLSIMPVPTSLFLFRGEWAAATGGLGAGTAAAGGAGGAAAGAGAAGIATGVVAKAAAVTAAVAVVGGVGSDVAARSDPATKTTREEAVQVSASAATHPSTAVATRPRHEQRRPALQVRASSSPASKLTAKTPAKAEKSVKTKKTTTAKAKAMNPPPGQTRAAEKAAPPVKAHKPAAKPVKANPSQTRREAAVPKKLRPVTPKPRPNAAGTKRGTLKTQRAVPAARATAKTKVTAGTAPPKTKVSAGTAQRDDVAAPPPKK